MMRVLSPLTCLDINSHIILLNPRAISLGDIITRPLFRQLTQARIVQSLTLTRLPEAIAKTRTQALSIFYAGLKLNRRQGTLCLLLTI
jgi:hypothetical protein